MCGISGIYKYGGGEVSEAHLIKMRDTLAHRGPDGAANYLSPDGKAGLSQRRLAIIDLRPEAACPMPNEDGSAWITFNGEIYNFEELRKELMSKGHTFRSHGDTETILHGYEEYGTDIVKHLNGMFAFVIWDDRKKIIFAARDHVGIKPFYYALQNGAFYFGSEIKAILVNPDFKKELNEPAISYYLAFSAMPAPHTLFQDVKKLPAAHALTLDQSGSLKIWEYWNPLRPKHEVPEDKSEEFYVEALKRLLKDSIRKQMVSDVPFGCFLSGGIDSSLNAALMSEALGEPVETFTIGTEGALGGRYNEFEYSRQMAERLGAKRHERLVTYGDFANFLEGYGKMADDPNGDQTCFLVYHLSELVRESGVTVVQTGEGGDELFAGYDTYRKADDLYGIWSMLEKLPDGLRGLPYSAAKMFGASDLTTELARRLSRKEQPFWGHAIAFSTVQKQKLLSPRLRKMPEWNQEYSVIAEHYRKARAADPDGGFLNHVAYLELKMRLSDFLLMRVDKMGMAHSIEARVPFLDSRIVELALHIPPELKLKGGLKNILKKASAKTLPENIINRKKQGFGSPVEEWLRSKETGAPLMKKIFGSSLAKRNIFDYKYVEEIAGRHAMGENHSFRLMNLLTLSLWYDAWF